MSTILPGNWPGSSSAAPARLCWIPTSWNAVRSASLRPPIQWRTSRGCSKCLLRWVSRGERYAELFTLQASGYR